MKNLVLILALLISSASMAQLSNYDRSQLFIKMKQGMKVPNHHLIKKTKHLFGDIYVVKTKDADKLALDLKHNKDVIYTERTYYSGKSTLPTEIISTQTESELSNFSQFNDPLISKVWSFNDASENGVSVNKAYTYPINRAKEDIIVAVVDTGVDYNHEDLKAVMWQNPNEIPGNGIDDDGNGYVDDVYGINTLRRNQDGVASGNPIFSHAHGTHVSGTIAAAQNNSIGIAGIASQAKIMAIRTVPDDADELDVDIVESFLYAAKHGAKLINCSFGKGTNEGGMVVNETINYIGETYGVLVVAAAGNDSMFVVKWDLDKKPKYPAAFDSDYLLVVASTTSSGNLSYFSNVGKISVDVAAPGSSIYSTMPGNKYASMDGTSMATPATVGVAAELWSHFPNLGPLEIKKVLMDSVTKVGPFANYMQSGGRVDLYNALQLASKKY